MATQIPSMPAGSTTEATPFPRSTQGDAASSVTPMIDRVVQGAHDAVDRVAQRAAPALDALGSKAADVSAVGDEWVTHCRSEVRAHPLTAVGLGVLAGLLVGRLMAR